jgi:hypothetical protein
LDYRIEITLTMMEITLPITAQDPFIADSTTALNSSLLWQEFEALKELVLAKAQMSGFHVAIQGSSIVCVKHDPPTCSKKNSDFIPLATQEKEDCC